MIRLFCALALILPPVTAHAAERRYAIGSFETVRIEGPFEVRIVTGKSPGAIVEGDRQLIDRVDIDLNGTVLVVRLGASGWGETPAGAATAPPVVTLTTPRLVAATINAGARVEIGRMAAQRVDLSVTGAGVVSLATADTDQLNATLIGTGTISLGGRALRARLRVNGPGAIDAAALDVNDLIVLVDGTGEARAAARYTAQVTSTGLGKVSVSGTAKCTIKAVAGGPVSCGAKR